MISNILVHEILTRCFSNPLELLEDFFLEENPSFFGSMSANTPSLIDDCPTIKLKAALDSACDIIKCTQTSAAIQYTPDGALVSLFAANLYQISPLSKSVFLHIDGVKPLKIDDNVCATLRDLLSCFVASGGELLSRSNAGNLSTDEYMSLGLAIENHVQDFYLKLCAVYQVMMRGEPPMEADTTSFFSMLFTLTLTAFQLLNPVVDLQLTYPLLVNLLTFPLPSKLDDLRVNVVLLIWLAILLPSIEYQVSKFLLGEVPHLNIDLPTNNARITCKHLKDHIAIAFKSLEPVSKPNTDSLDQKFKRDLVIYRIFITFFVGRQYLASHEAIFDFLESFLKAISEKSPYIATCPQRKLTANINEEFSDILITLSDDSTSKAYDTILAHTNVYIPREQPLFSKMSKVKDEHGISFTAKSGYMGYLVIQGCYCIPFVVNKI